MSSKKIRYYADFDEDFYQTEKEYTLDKDYEYLPKNVIDRLWAAFIYGIALIISSVYCRLILGVRIVGAEKLRKERGAYFLYGNHTQPIGDVFNPALACFPKRIHTIVSPANLYLPFIGRLIRPLGGIPLPSTLSGMKKFNQAIKTRTEQGRPIVIYPEAHLWDYYTDIRPFDESSFVYPLKFGAPAFCFTTTYQRKKKRKKPRITIYVDGPFFAEGQTKREKAKSLKDKVYSNMKMRSKMSDYEYFEYVKRSK